MFYTMRTLFRRLFSTLVTKLFNDTPNIHNDIYMHDKSNKIVDEFKTNISLDWSTNESQQLVIVPNNNDIDNLRTKYFNSIKDDIRNMRILNARQIEFVKNLTHDEKNELFDIMNSCLITINDFFMYYNSDSQYNTCNSTQ